MESCEHRLKNGALFVIREAVLADAPALLEFNEDTSRESDNLSFGEGEFGLTLSQEEESILRSRKADNCLLIVGSIDDRIVARLGFSGGKRPRVRHRGEFGISVRKDYWDLGIGGLLLDVLIDWAKSSGVVTKINLHVRSDNQRAIALYQKKGFVKEGTIRNDMRISGIYFDCDCMGLDVNSL
jgi:RimJ/RimL family protein N-acetyltransferase